MKLVGRLALLLLLPLAACDRPRYGKVVGDAFLVVGMEGEVDLAGVAVHLLAELEDDDSNPLTLRIDTVLASICVQRDRFIAQASEAAAGRGAAATDSLRVLARDAYDRAWRARDRLLRDAVLRTVHAGPRAEFVLDSIAPGDYRIWADTVIDAEHWTWLQRLEIEAGDSIRLNLNDANVDTNPFRCKAPE